MHFTHIICHKNQKLKKKKNLVCWEIKKNQGNLMEIHLYSVFSKTLMNFNSVFLFSQKLFNTKKAKVFDTVLIYLLNLN